MFNTAALRMTEDITVAVNHNLEKLGLKPNTTSQMKSDINDFVRSLLVNHVDADWSDESRSSSLPLLNVTKVIEGALGNTLVSNIVIDQTAP